jgi:hypothetical protein
MTKEFSNAQTTNGADPGHSDLVILPSLGFRHSTLNRLASVVEISAGGQQAQWTRDEERMKKADLKFAAFLSEVSSQQSVVSGNKDSVANAPAADYELPTTGSNT